MPGDLNGFEHERPGLRRLAYGILGTSADAEDVVQETWLRWSRAAPGEVQNTGAWLTRVCSRLAIDRLRQVRSRREEYVGPWLPEPLVPGAASAAERVEIDEAVSVALLAVLERLTPAERAAFLLHDVFGHDFEAVGEILGKSAVAARKLASRARSDLAHQRPRRAPSLDEHRGLLAAFRDAACGGDEQGLRALLAADVRFRADGGGKAQAVGRPLHGVDAVVRFLLALSDEFSAGESELCWFNGAPGWVLRQGGRAVTAFALDVDDGVIRGVDAQRNPDKLARFDAT